MKSDFKLENKINKPSDSEAARYTQNLSPLAIGFCRWARGWFAVVWLIIYILVYLKRKAPTKMLMSFQTCSLWLSSVETLDKILRNVSDWLPTFFKIYFYVPQIKENSFEIMRVNYVFPVNAFTAFISATSNCLESKIKVYHLNDIRDCLIKSLYQRRNFDFFFFLYCQTFFIGTMENY